MGPDAEAERPVDAEDRIRILYELASAAGAELEVEGLVRAMGDVLRRTFPHELMDLVLPDPEQGTLRIHTLVEPEGLPDGPGAGASGPGSGPGPALAPHEGGMEGGSGC